MSDAAALSILAPAQHEAGQAEDSMPSDGFPITPLRPLIALSRPPLAAHPVILRSASPGFGPGPESPRSAAPPSRHSGGGRNPLGQRLTSRWFLRVGC